MYLGDIVPGQVLRDKFTTVDATGAPTVLTAAPLLVVYKDDSTAENSSAISLTVSFDGKVGMNHWVLTTGLDPTFYSSGSDFQVAVGSGTVSGISLVGYVVGAFSINKRSALRPIVDGRSLAISAAGVADAQVKGLDTDTVTAAAIAANAIGASEIANDAITSAKVADGFITAPKITDGSFTAAKFAAGAFDAVWTVATRTLTSFGTLVADVATAVWGAGTRTLTAFSTALAVSVWDVLASAVATASSIGLQIKTNLDAAVSTRLATSGYTAPPTSAENADAVWDEAIAGHLTAGSTGAALNAAGSAGDPWTTPLPGVYGVGTAGFILANTSADTDSIKAKTDNLPPDPADASDIAAAFAAVPAAVWAAGTRTLTSFGTLAADVWAVGTRTLTGFGTLVADVATAVWAAAIRTLTAFSFTASANVTQIGGDTGSLDRFKRATDTEVLGTVDVGSSTTSIITSSLSPAAIVIDQFKGRVVLFDRATTTTALRGQGTRITASSVGGVLTVEALSNAPASGDTFVIV